MKKLILILTLNSMIISQAMAYDVRVKLTTLPDYFTKKVCATVENVDGDAVTGVLSFRIEGLKILKNIPMALAAGAQATTICESYTKSENLDKQIAFLRVEFFNQNKMVLDYDQKYFSTYEPGHKFTSSEKQVIPQNPDAQMIIDRISTIKSCLRHEECLGGAIDQMDYSCVSQKISMTGKLIQQKIPNSQYLIDALSFECNGDISYCSGTTYVSPSCVYENLKFVIKELNRL